MTRPPVRIAGGSGSTVDRRSGFAKIAAAFPNDPVDVIIGDFMSEGNMTTMAAKRAGGTEEVAYDAGFLESLELALEDVAKYRIKIVVNAGGSDTCGLHRDVTELLRRRGVSLNVAWISGDDVLATMLDRDPETFSNVHTDQSLAAWPFKPIAAQAYLGGLGIAAALTYGADIVLCGRVSDASLVIGAAAWYHGWLRNGLPQISKALVAGHLIECSTYVTGGNFSGFRELEHRDKWLDLGYPIAEIGAEGEVVITKQRGTGGMVTVETCTAQLLYEIQGPWYFNSDVTAILSDISFTQIGVDRVSVSGIKWAPPPRTTKVGITGLGGYQAEMLFYLVGLDIPAKARLMEKQVRYELREQIEQLSSIQFQLLGSSEPNARTQNMATVTLRIVAQAQDAEALGPLKFARPLMDLIMSSYPGGTCNLDIRPALPRPVYEYFVTSLDQHEIRHRAHLNDGKTVDLPPPIVTWQFPRQQPSHPESKLAGLYFGPTVRVPLGLVANARSGDKGSDANVGIFVSDDEQWEWLRRFLDVERMKELLASEYTGDKILPNIRAVHFLLHNHLDRGVSCTMSVDCLGKNVAEFLRSRYVEIPKKFLLDAEAKL
ncbi:unnamed protein product [Mycena citricolor]|uniref:DUF1446-domain-containing protein n=1 Tax=Mycena citricolor TaxID=2018698 RepID=A0AAD2GX19_9AGAR|nr:unnamed protein product [Mycena citricolor]CAK5265888.1 unnamed protein product [Mycena citricolor]